MDFSEEQTSSVHSSLSQFSEPTARSDTAVTAGYTSSNVQSQAVQTTVYTTAASTSQKSMNSPTKYTGPLFSWPNPNAVLQLCEKQGIQTINIPNYGQNANSMLGVQANNLSANNLAGHIMSYLPSTSHTDMLKQDIAGHQLEEQKNSDSNTESQLQQQQQQSAVVAEYLQKWQATAALQQLLKLQTEQIKKEKMEEERIDHPQNNILNIPNVSVFRNSQLQNSSTYMDQMMVAINPSEVNMENEQENEGNLQPLVKEQQIQTDSPKMEKKPKFRAKMGEIKISVTVDGSTLYCCPECNLVFPNKTGIEQHIQAHIQERKYQCKECGAMLKRKEHLDQHMRGHSDERPFKCPVCEKAFKRNEHLTRHYVIHSGNKNFSCNICQKAFSRKDHLNKHTQTHLGIRKNKTKKDSYYIDQRDLFDKGTDNSMISKHDINYVLKDNCLGKPETTSFFHQIQNFQKDSNLLRTFSSFKEQSMRDAGVLQQQSVNTNEILPQNAKYLMPS